MSCSRNIFINCHKCSHSKGRPFCPFNCNLSCAAFTCDGVTTRGANRRRIAIDFSVRGANGVSTSRITRICIRSMRSSIPHPLGRLGKCRGMFLGGKRGGQISIILSRSTFSFCSVGRRHFMIRGKSFRVLINPTSDRLPLGTVIRLW